MSETDDTDDLLLIPPDLFAAGELEQPYFDIVDELIKQVGSLQGRVETIESTSEISFGSSTMKKYEHHSAHTTPQKPRVRPKSCSLPNSPNVDGFGGRKLSKKLNGGVEEPLQMNDIDNFLSKFKNNERSRTARRLFNNRENMIDVMDELERQSRKIEERLKVNETEDILGKKNAYRCGDDINSVPDYGAGVRRQLYSNEIPEKNINSSLSPTDLKSTDSSSDSTQLTAYNQLHLNALNVLGAHRNLLNNSSKKSPNTASEGSLGLVSLGDIWGNVNRSDVPQKLHEERLRRKHCEQLIHELQQRNLELQQKVSVAVGVDESKNDALRQLREALAEAVTRADKAYNEKLTLEGELNKLRERSAHEAEQLAKKACSYEKEASKALNLAHGNQEKLAMLENRCEELRIKSEALESEKNSIEQSYLKEVEKNKQLTDILGQKEIDLNESRSVLAHARAEISQSKKAVEICEAEFASLKRENDTLRNELREQKTTSIELSKKNRQLMDELESSKSKEKHLKKQLDGSSTELKQYYQGQLEALVQGKLKEFQGQLDAAENKFKEELRRRELSIAKTAAAHIQQISEKCSLEIKLLEEKQREEMRLLQLRAAQQNEEVETLRKKLESQREKGAQLEKQLRRFMESQWSEALKIFTDNKTQSPLPPVSDKQESTTVLEVASEAPSPASKEVQKYIDMLLNYNGDSHRAAAGDANDIMIDPSSANRRSGKPPWK